MSDDEQLPPKPESEKPNSTFSQPAELLPRPLVPVGTRIRETWLTRRPSTESIFIAAIATLALVIGSVLGWSHPALAATRHAVFEQGEWWRAWTTIFVHADAAHLASNSMLFFIFAFFLFGHFGFLVFPLAAFLFGGIANFLVLSSYAPDVRLVGASGVVYWCGGTWLVLYYFLSRQKNLKHRIVRTLGVAILLFAPAETFQPNISHETHFAGFALGCLFGTSLYFVNRKKYLSAEVHETIFEEQDEPLDDLPGPEGFKP
ncbi:MAG: rhomboid family intramembrane serine protease [Proteobacteria bacterium]|nr:MAG: rhomboid family intramembrane serine protease [Pseudomonadota bacterium]